jgi:hypothetical protein
VPISPAGSYVPITTPVVETLFVDELQPGRDRAVREQAFARPDDQGEDPEAELVDEVVAQERLDQVPAAVHLQLRPIFLLERGDPFGRVSLDQDRLAPLQCGTTPRNDVLGRVVQRLGAGLVCGVRPVGGEDVVGLAPEQEVERRAHRLPYDLAHPLVPVVDRPATESEAAALVLFRTARGLHDPVERQKGVHDQLSHRSCPFESDSWRVKLTAG